MPAQTRNRVLNQSALTLIALGLLGLAPTATAGDFGSLGLDGVLGAIWSVFGILGSLAALGASYLFYRMANHRALFTLLAILLVSGVISRTLVFLLQHSEGGLAGLPMTALNGLSGVMTLVQWGALVVAGIMAFQPGQPQPPRE